MGTTILGKYSYIVGNVKNTFSISNFIVGNFCSIASGLTLMLGGDHATNLVMTTNFVNIIPDLFAGLPSPFPMMGLTKGDIVIENDVWIGQDVTIMSGVKISNGAIIGTAAVIAKDVPPYAIVIGNPARIVKYRFNQEIIDRLLKIAWWNWPIEKIRENYDYFINPNIEEFVNKFDSEEV
jgi:acetyltransferase-like isoleucine patch superfamily enzyme